ncbi:hypothetical protein GCM10007415_17180 [Parapedobacter pyrenivorans]|uniref:DUF2249 domain-containing protein n=1 Tax=Parapedobacter pyrenivorans TaxID=1305674 RepID=A0A917HNT8_9SPHI|nr:DUF2249 domain-containing protein [Parapedobacter pyrenivorans]GGG84565.1 hypothetical protein GCM10007415_17180 [Parapedobacter pyrenivorans]
MVINKNTRVAEVIRANADSIAAIAALAKPLRKLKNPLLRRVMAPRVTLAEAAAIGGCSLAAIRAALEPLGFQFVEEELADNRKEEGKEQRPDWLAAGDEASVAVFDVRELIESGNDPLKAIVQRYRALPMGNLLCIINTFIPYPLINLLGKQGAETFVETVADQVYHTWFFKQGVSERKLEAPQSDRVMMHDSPSFGRVLAAYNETQLVWLDVRHLSMPQPMETILETLPTLVAGQALYVLHKRVPLHLLEELTDMAYRTHIHEAGEGDVKLLIVRRS